MARGKSCFSVCSRVEGVLQDAGCSAVAATPEQVLQGGQWAADDSLGSVDDPLESSPVRCWASSVPHREAVRQHTLDGAAIGGHQQLLRQVDFDEVPQEVEPLLNFISVGCLVSSWDESNHNQVHRWKVCELDAGVDGSGRGAVMGRNEMWWPILTVAGRFVKKSLIQLQVVGGSPRSVSFVISLTGMTVLNEVYE